MAEALGVADVYDGLCGSLVSCSAAEPAVEGIRAVFKQQINASWAKEAVRQGVAHAKAGSYEEAHRCYAKAMELYPDCPDAHVARGAAFANERHLERAADDFEAALRLDPNHANASKYLAAVRAHLRAAEEASHEAGEGGGGGTADGTAGRTAGGSAGKTTNGIARGTTAGVQEAHHALERGTATAGIKALAGAAALPHTADADAGGPVDRNPAAASRGVGAADAGGAAAAAARQVAEPSGTRIDGGRGGAGASHSERRRSSLENRGEVSGAGRTVSASVGEGKRQISHVDQARHAGSGGGDGDNRRRRSLDAERPPACAVAGGGRRSLDNSERGVVGSTSGKPTAGAAPRAAEVASLSDSGTSDDSDTAPRPPPAPPSGDDVRRALEVVRQARDHSDGRKRKRHKKGHKSKRHHG